MNAAVEASDGRRASRRALIGGLVALAFAPPRAARAGSGPPTVGYLFGGEKGATLDVLYRTALVESLAEQGYVIPDKLRWLDRYTGVMPDRPSAEIALQRLTQGLVTEGADLIITNGV